MKRAALVYAGFILSLLAEVLGLAGIAMASQLMAQNDPVAKSLSGVFIGLLLIAFGVMIALYRASTR